MLRSCFVGLVFCGVALPVFSARELPSGEDAKRPYEMVWANRTQDHTPPLLAMTDAAGWTVKTHNAVATLTRATDRRLFGDGVLRLVYRATGARPSVSFRPPSPVPVKGGFDTLSCWVYGQGAYYVRHHAPAATVWVDFLDAAGKPFSVYLMRINFHEWHLGWRRLGGGVISRVKKGATFVGFTLKDCTNTEEFPLDFTSFCAFKDPLAPLSFAPRAKRPNRVFPEAPAGVNTGHGLLPFPNSPLGVTPSASPDARLVFALPTCASAWDELAVRWQNAAPQRVADGGGVWFVAPGSGKPAVRRTVTSTTVTTNCVELLDVTMKDVLQGGATVTTRFHREGMSLVVDVATDSKDVSEVRFGAWKNPPSPQRVTFPYYTYGSGGEGTRPGVLAVELDGAALFHAATMDWTQSNASEPYSLGLRFDGALAANGGTRYLTKTDGRRNVCRERFVYSFGTKLNDVLPNVPNPPSGWKHVTGTGVWRAHAASNREKDVARWRDVRARGLKHLIVTDHETCWRDGNESFTFRTDFAPKKGGAKGQYDYARVMIDELGFVYGPYNNFTDFAPVNGNWRADRVSRLQNNQLCPAWNRCYAPKPLYAVEACEQFTPVNQAQGGFNTAYCDVHTAVTPWSRTDFDARVPGAGTFAQTFYAFGEIMLIQKNCWKGPVYSEGNNHFLYCGLTDGNYAQDQNYNMALHAWLVDFDLLRLHPLCCNFGMGSPEMFYPGKCGPKDPDAYTDRFLAATVAFGHPGFLVSGREGEDRSYFMIQALAAKYTQANVREIRYVDEDGTAYPSEAAIRKGVYRRSQVVVRYEDGTLVAANGSMLRPMLVKELDLWLPPNGYFGRSGDGSVLVFSGLRNGHRVDYARSPEYVYMDGRGVETSFPGGTAKGVVVRLREKEEGAWPVAKVSDFAALSRPPSSLMLTPAEAKANGLPEVYCAGMQVRGGREEAVNDSSGAQAHAGSRSCGGVEKRGFVLHPPYVGGVAGRVFVRYWLEIPPAGAKLSAVVGKGDGSDPGDGIYYSVLVESDGTTETVATQHVITHEWKPIVADVSKWKGKQVKVTLVCDCGPKNNTSGDWGAWAELNCK